MAMCKLTGMTEGGQPEMDLHDLLRPDEQRRFRALCIETTSEELSQLVEVVEMHLDHIRSNAGPVADVETAELIGNSLVRLLSADGEFDDGQRSMIRGAVEYYLMTDDAAGDLEDALGFDDDARVLNSMLDRIERPEFKVDLPS